MKVENFANRSADAIWTRGGGSRTAETTSNGRNAPTTTATVTPVAGEIEEAADFNETFDWETDSGLQTHISDLSTARGNVVLPHGPNTPGTVAWQIDAGWAQDVSDGVITYGFADYQHALGLNNNPSFGEGRGYSPFTEAQRDAARIAIENWDDLISATFVEVEQGPGASDYGRQTTDIMLANTSSGPAQAWAYYPGYSNQYARVAGDVWVADPNYNGSNFQLDPGFYGLQTLNHELGHSLGLSHPGNYNFGDDQDGDGLPDPITYEGDAFYFQDSHQFTIMSYFDSYETGAQNIDWNLMRFVYPSTPMVDDIAVIQQKYGADYTTRDGNTTYGFNATDDVTNEAMRFEADEMFTIFTIWDGDGNDTLDLSGYYTDSVIDLREGAYSSAGGAGAYDEALAGTQLTLAQINANNADAGQPNRSATLYNYYFNGVDGVNEGISWREITGTGSEYLMEQNIGIAYGAIIENAIGGHGDDRINGNQADNMFTGGAGDDTFIIARYGDDDTSVDTITDFEAGDTLDLTELGDLDAGDVSYVGNTLTIDTADGDLTVIINGSFTTDDIIFG